MRRSAFTCRIELVVVAAAMSMLAGCNTPVHTVEPPTAQSHPLDSLSSDELLQTVDILREAGHVNDATRFANIELREPSKDTVLVWTPGAPIPRAAFAIIKQDSQTFEAVVDLSTGQVSSWTEIEGIQPSVLFEEFEIPGEVLTENAAFSAAMAARGYDMDDVFCVPHTLGNYAIPGHERRRLLKVPCFVLGDDARWCNRASPPTRATPSWTTIHRAPHSGASSTPMQRGRSVTRPDTSCARGTASPTACSRETTWPSG